MISSVFLHFQTGGSCFHTVCGHTQKSTGLGDLDVVELGTLVLAAAEDQLAVAALKDLDGEGDLVGRTCLVTGTGSHFAGLDLALVVQAIHGLHDHADIGILISDDPVAIDQACLDLVYASKDPGRDHLLERIESRNGVHTIEAAAELGFGTREYELVEV